jgi:hypothetical protein
MKTLNFIACTTFGIMSVTSLLFALDNKNFILGILAIVFAIVSIIAWKDYKDPLQP